MLTRFSRHLTLLGTMLVLWVGLSPASLAAGQKLFCEAAQSTQLPDGVPGYSDVCMRLFVKRPENAELKAGLSETRQLVVKDNGPWAVVRCPAPSSWAVLIISQ